MKLWASVKDPGGWKTLGEESCKEKANNTIFDLVTNKMNSMASGTSEIGNAFLKFLDKASEDKFHKKMIKEEKLKI